MRGTSLFQFKDLAGGEAKTNLAQCCKVSNIVSTFSLKHLESSLAFPDLMNDAKCWENTTFHTSTFCFANFVVYFSTARLDRGSGMREENTSCDFAVWPWKTQKETIFCIFGNCYQIEQDFFCRWVSGWSLLIFMLSGFTVGNLYSIYSRDLIHCWPYSDSIWTQQDYTLISTILLGILHIYIFCIAACAYAYLDEIST